MENSLLAKVECCSCHLLYYIRTDLKELPIPEHIYAGEAFPSECPLCEYEGKYAIFLAYW